MAVDPRIDLLEKDNIRLQEKIEHLEKELEELRRRIGKNQGPSFPFDIWGMGGGKY